MLLGFWGYRHLILWVTLLERLFTSPKAAEFWGYLSVVARRVFIGHLWVRGQRESSSSRKPPWSGSKTTKTEVQVYKPAPLPSLSYFLTAFFSFFLFTRGFNTEHLFLLPGTRGERPTSPCDWMVQNGAGLMNRFKGSFGKRSIQCRLNYVRCREISILLRYTD